MLIIDKWEAFSKMLFEAENVTEAVAALMQPPFAMSEAQATHAVSMKPGSLTKSGRHDLERDKEQREEEIRAKG